MKKSRFTLLAAALVFVTSGCGTNIQDTHSFSAMDTFMTVRSVGKNSYKANRLIEQRIYKIEKLISVTDSESEVYKLNNAKEFPVELSEETFFLTQYAQNFYSKTQGALNVCLFPVIKEWGFTTGQYKIPSHATIKSLLSKTDFSKVILQEDETSRKISMPQDMMINFGAIGKGYAGDAAIEILKQNGITSAVLDFGGNVQLLGGKITESGKVKNWKVGIKNPFGEGSLLSVDLQDKAVITSGGYERFFTGNDGKKYIHIFDSNTGYPVENEIASVTIICEKGIYADALSTSLFAMGLEKAREFWKNNKDFDFIIITKDKEIFATPDAGKIMTVLEKLPVKVCSD